MMAGTHILGDGTRMEIVDDASGYSIAVGMHKDEMVVTFYFSDRNAKTVILTKEAAATLAGVFQRSADYAAGKP